MNGIMNENVFVKEYDFNKPLIQKIGSLIDNSMRDCHNKYFHTFKYESICDIKLTSITNNELINLTIKGKSMNLYELKKN